MKRTLALIMALLFAIGTVPAFAESCHILVDKEWKILVPENPTDAEQFAADKLKTCLGEVFGSEIETVTDADEKFIAIGSASSCDVDGIADNGYRIAVINGNIHINGTAQRGLQIAAYRFLEKFCGRKVYTSKITVMPQSDAILVPIDTDIVYEPYFESTDTDWRSPLNTEYSMANGLTSGSRRTIPAEMGGSVDYLGGFCHTIGGLCETEKYADSHPEYLALHDGERTADQPCLTNPDVLRICTENVLKILEEKHNPDAPLQIVSVTQNDNTNYCECENCKAFEASHGGKQSATMLNFVNQIADTVKENGYDNVAVDTFAYQYTLEVPEGITPRENVIIRMCPILCCMAHALDDECNKQFYQALEDWSEVCDRLYIWDYATHYLHPCAVIPNFGIIQRNMQIYHEHNVKGIYVEGNYFVENCDTEFAELRAYMISKCMQDPYCDLDSDIDGFLDAYYGPGGRYMRKIIDIFTKRAGSFDGHMTFIYGSWAVMRPIMSAEVSVIDSLWKNAKLAAKTGEQFANLKRSELSWRWWKANAAKGEFSHLNPKRGDRQDELYQDLLDAGVTILQEFENEDIREIDKEVIRYAPPDYWHVGNEEKPVVKNYIKINKLAEKFPPLFAIVAYFYTMAHS